MPTLSGEFSMLSGKNILLEDEDKEKNKKR